jgi:hypothetical protein
MVVPSKHSYTDFDLLVERIEGQAKYQVRVLRSPGGEGKGEFAFPFDSQELENFFLKIGQRRDDLRSLQIPQIEAAQKFGSKLFDTVFSDEISNVLATSLVKSSGLRIRLRMNGAPELAQLPWEFLFHKTGAQFLALERDTPIVRYLELKHGPRSLSVKPPIRILVVIASPEGLRKLNTEDERNRLKSALHELRVKRKIVLDFLVKSTLDDLQKRLQQDQFHVLHFIGHGEFNSVSGEGILLFENDRRGRDEVNGEDLGVILHNHDSLRLVVINACEGGRSARDDAFAGVGQTLMKRGLPAVIAMQFPISDRAAIVFAGSFYTALANGYPVDAALVEARTALYTKRKQLGIEWGTPVLYMRSPDGRLFDVDLEESEPTGRLTEILGVLRISSRTLSGVIEIAGISAMGLLVLSSIFTVVAHAPTQRLPVWTLLFLGWKAAYLIAIFLSIAGYAITKRYLASSARRLLMTFLGLTIFYSSVSYSESNFKLAGMHFWFEGVTGPDTIQLQIVSASSGEPIPGARLTFFVDGHPVDDILVDNSGQLTYAIQNRLAEISVRISAPHFHDKLLNSVVAQGRKQIVGLISDQNSQPEVEPFTSLIPFTGFPLNVNQDYQYGFSSLQSDGAVWGERVQIQGVTVEVTFATRRSLVSFDTWVLLGPKPFGYKSGQVDGDWGNGINGQWGAGALNMKLTSDVAPAQYRFVLGRGKKDPKVENNPKLGQENVEKQRFVGTFKFGDSAPSGNVLEMKEVFGPSIDLPHGLYAQLYFWADVESQASIESASITVHGLRHKNSD